MLIIPAFGYCIVIAVLLAIASFVAPVFGAIVYAVSSIAAKILNKKPQHINKPAALISTALIFFLTFCGLSYYVFDQSPPPPVPDGFKETDLIGTWQATYGTPDTKDTLKLKSDGTYQQIFQLPAGDYYYEGSWNKWHLEHTTDGRPKLHLEGMRYCAYTIYQCETSGRGEPELYYDFIDNEGVQLTNELILRVVGDDESPKGISLWHLQGDPDNGPEHFVFLGE